MIKQACSLTAYLSLSTLLLIGCSQVSQVSNSSEPSLAAVEFVSGDHSAKGNAAKPKTVAAINVAAGKRVIARAGGITYPGWANANDAVDYGTTTKYPKPGRWGNETNQGRGTFQVVDLGAVYLLNKVGYHIDWDGAFKNSLNFRVEVSTNNKTWKLVSQIVHPYSATGGSNKLDGDVAIQPTNARYVKYSEPPDGSWNGWGTFHQLRAYSAKKK